MESIKFADLTWFWKTKQNNPTGVTQISISSTAITNIKLQLSSQGLVTGVQWL